MKFAFKDIYEESMYDTCKCMIVTGPYNVFNNIVIDKLKEMCKPVNDVVASDNALSEFGLTRGNMDISSGYTVAFPEFMEVIRMPNINGKWFCVVDIATVNKKQMDFIDEYVKSPSDNGILVVLAQEYKDYVRLLKNSAVNNGPHTHLIQLSFPNRQLLSGIVQDMFNKRKVELEERANELFIMRMSSEYDDYEMIIDRICVGKEGVKLTYNEMLSELKGIENFVIDDFIDYLVTSDKANSKPYKMMCMLMKEKGPIDLVNKLKRKINELIEFRIAINTGYIPILGQFSIAESKRNLGEDHKLSKVSDFQFRRLAKIASKTSLRDWMYMILILDNIGSKFKDESYEKVLISLINRKQLKKDTLNSVIGIKDICHTELDRLDQLPYFNRDMIDKIKDRRSAKILKSMNISEN